MADDVDAGNEQTDHCDVVIMSNGDRSFGRLKSYDRQTTSAPRPMAKRFQVESY
jgi:hypothetical protein